MASGWVPAAADDDQHGSADECDARDQTAPTDLLAKQLATLDVLSKGRVTIALGAGWQDVEFEVTQMPFNGRFSRLEEMVSAFRELWGGAPANFSGKHFSFEDFYSVMVKTSY